MRSIENATVNAINPTVKLSSYVHIKAFELSGSCFAPSLRLPANKVFQSQKSARNDDVCSKDGCQLSPR